MYRTASRRLILAILVALLVALGYTSQTLHAKKPVPNPYPPDRPVLYRVTWIPGLEVPSDATLVADVNAVGQFVGKEWNVDPTEQSRTRPIYGCVDESDNRPVHDYLYVDDLLPSDLTAYEAIGINDQGRIVGQCKSEEGLRKVFAYDYDDVAQTGVVHVMEVPPGYEEYRQRAMRLAEDGTVVGYIYVPDFGQVGFIWIPGTEAIVLSPDVGTVTGINNQGDIVGQGMFYSAWPYEEPVLLEQSAAIGFGFAINPATGPDINDAGTIVGTPAPEKREKYYHAAYCNPSNNFAWTELPSKYSSYALAINDIDENAEGAQIVGAPRRKANIQSVDRLRRRSRGRLLASGRSDPGRFRWKRTLDVGRSKRNWPC